MDVLLGQAELSKGDSGSDLDLSGDNVDTGDLLYNDISKLLGKRRMVLTSNGVLDLDTGVDLNEVVSALLVDQELGSTGVSVVNGFGQAESVVKNGLSDRFVKVRSWGDLDHLYIGQLYAQWMHVHLAHLLVSSLN